MQHKAQTTFVMQLKASEILNNVREISRYKRIISLHTKKDKYQYLKRIVKLNKINGISSFYRLRIIL